MKYVPYLLKHLRRNWVRTTSTVLAIALCIFLFCTVQSVLATINSLLESSSANRLVTRHAVSLIFNMPLAYKARIEGLDGVKRVFEEPALSQITPSGDKNITIICDTKLSGSASSRAQLCPVNFRESHCKSGIHGIINAMGDGTKIPQNALFFMFGGMAHGHKAQLLKCFPDDDAKVLPKGKRTM